jgi:hypothetical protein
MMDFEGFFQDSGRAFQAGNFAWPKEISDAINWVFNLMTVALRPQKFCVAEND